MPRRLISRYIDSIHNLRLLLSNGPAGAWAVAMRRMRMMALHTARRLQRRRSSNFLI
jgi:hypothetical protein